MTRSAGTSGLMRAGSPPRSAIASRIAARSTTAGTPVKSWRMTRAGHERDLGLAGAARAPRGQGAHVLLGRRRRRRACRSTFSSRTLTVNGQRGRGRAPARRGGRWWMTGRRPAGSCSVARTGSGRTRTGSWSSLHGPRRGERGGSAPDGCARLGSRSIRLSREYTRAPAARAAILTAQPAWHPQSRPALARGRRAPAGPTPTITASPGHRHPHPPDDPSGHPRIGFVGAGHVGTHAGRRHASAPAGRSWPCRAATRCAWRALPVARAHARSPWHRRGHRGRGGPRLRDRAGRRHRGRRRPAAAVRRPGDRAYQRALAAEVLAPARRRAPSVGSFHPLVAFADLERAVAALPGATVALEGDGGLVDAAGRAGDGRGRPARAPAARRQARLSRRRRARRGRLRGAARCHRGGRPRRWPGRGGRARHLRAAHPRQTLANAERWASRAALTGPFVRGDVSTVRGHLDAIDRLAPGVVAVYRALAQRELGMAVARGALSPERAAAMERLLDG